MKTPMRSASWQSRHRGLDANVSLLPLSPALTLRRSVFVTEMPDGYALTPYDPALAEQIEAGREFLRDYRDTSHHLAK